MNATAKQANEVTGADELPGDLIEARHAARIAQVHVSGVHRWVLKGKLRGWQRIGRLFVSRAELVALFTPVATAEDRRGELPTTRRERSRQDKWTDDVLRKFGVRK